MAQANLADLSDDRLADLARTGEAAAWEELIRRHYPRLERRLTARTGDPQDGADLAQETFFTAWRRIERLPADRPFVPWLYQVAHYAFLPWWRRRKLHYSSLDVLVERTRWAFGVVRGRPNELEAVEERDLIQRALDGLSPILREALLLHAQWGLTAREIAMVLDITESAAEQRVGRALRAFRQLYATAGPSVR